jgi:hypothetical protein
MGLNVDLTLMLGVPKTIDCPFCKKPVETGWDDFDIECGDPNKKPGEWKLFVYCDLCERSWNEVFEISLNHRHTVPKK